MNVLVYIFTAICISVKDNIFQQVQLLAYKIYIQMLVIVTFHLQLVTSLQPLALSRNRVASLMRLL